MAHEGVSPMLDGNRGYEQHHHHHHHHVMPHQQRGDSMLAISDSFAPAPPRRTDSSMANMTTSQTCMEPTWKGFIHTTFDALIVLEACLQGDLHHIPRRPHDRERPHIITGGNVFIYEENASGIKRWTDGVTWSPSRIMGNFLVYRELNEPFPAGEKKKAKKRKRTTEEYDYNMHPQAEEDRKLVGSLVDSYGFKQFGLIKKTLNVKVNGVNHHIVSYYNLDDVKSGKCRRPKHDPILAGHIPRDTILFQPSFKCSAIDSEEDATPLDPFHQERQNMPTPMQHGQLSQAPMQNGLIQQNHLHHAQFPSGHVHAHTPPPIYNGQPQLQVHTGDAHLFAANEQAFHPMSASVMTQSPHSSVSASLTPNEYYPFSNPPSAASYLAMPDGLQYDGKTDRTDSIMDGQPQFKTEPDFTGMPAFTSAGSESSPLPPTLTHSLSHPSDMYAVHGLPAQYSHVDGHDTWAAQHSDFTNEHAQMLPNAKRRQTVPQLLPINPPRPHSNGFHATSNGMMYSQHIPQFTAGVSTPPHGGHPGHYIP